ncbi:MAG TPA: ectonucleotide pyrophosphatase/phosphodiesterase [Longimicrobium sp.]|nr:ectonucleotide pyrophosphatase/phosphodiesterase [Longimicrobium sp.]
MEARRRPRAEHVVLISIDGLRPEYYLDPTWPAPAMRQLYLRGAHAAAVRTIFPSLTYPAHTTLATGALPARHGVHHDRETAAVERPRWLRDESLVRVPALWDAVRAAGGTTASLYWPMTAGGPIDWCIPEIWADERTLDEIRAAATPPGLLDELEREATGRLTEENFGNRLLAHDPRVAAMAAYLFERYRPTLLLAHTQATVQVPQEPDWRNPRRARAVAASDLVVSLVLEVIERTKAWDRTAVIVCGDHGMMEIHTQLRPNVWLAEAGLRDERIEGQPWCATFHALGGSAFLDVGEPADENTAAVRRVLDALPRGVRETFRIVERDELERLGSDPDAPLALAAAPGFGIDDRGEGPALRPNPGMTHGHHPDEPAMNTGLVAAGAGIRAGAMAPVLPLTCVAPLVAELLGLDFDAPDGALYPGLLQD